MKAPRGGIVLSIAFSRDDRRMILRELEEEYVRHVRPGSGAVRARGWYWRQLLGSVGSELWRRGRRRVSGERLTRLPAAIAHDTRQAFRLFSRAPAFAALAGATIALGLASSTAVFSVLDAVLLRPLPYREPERLVRVWPRWNVSKSVMEKVIDGTRESLSEAAGYLVVQRSLLGLGDPVDLPGLAVSPRHFALLGVEPVLGRAFTEDEFAPGTGEVIVLSHSLWTSTFGGDPGILGASIRLGDERMVVVGVLPPSHRPVGRETRYWIPMTVDRADFSDYEGIAQVQILARLGDDVSLQQAAENLRAVAGGVRADAPGAFGEDWVDASAPEPLHGYLVTDVRAALWATMAAVSCLLLIACANVANLLLARATDREREVAIRLAIGARPASVGRQTLLESVLLAVAGCAVGVPAARGLLGVLGATWTAALPFAEPMRMDGRVVAFALATAVGTGVLFGVAPAVRAARTDPEPRLQDGGQFGGTASSQRLSRTLVGLQVALAVVLTLAAGLMFRTLGSLTRVDPGFDPGDTSTMRLRLDKFAGADERAAFLAQIRERLAAIPGVDSVGGGTFLPMATGTPSAIYRVDDVEYPPDVPPPNALFQHVVGDYFGALRIPLLRGRTQGPADPQEGPHAAVINEAMVRAAFPDRDPIGERLTMFGGTPLVVVGVVGDTRQRSPAEPPDPEVFLSYERFNWWPSLYLAVRGVDGPPSAASLREAIWEIDPEIPIADMRTMEQVVAAASAESRFLTQLLSLFGLFALALGTIGVYGVMSYAVSGKVREHGIRLAIGATPASVRRRALWQGLRPTLLGLAAGTAGALVLGRALQGRLHGIEARDPLTFVVVPVTLLLVAGAATYLPARRAARVDPVRSLTPR